MKCLVLESPAARLEQSPNPGQCWLVCDECRRFFQYASAKPLGAAGGERCPFADCYGHGLGFNLFFWDDLRPPDDPRWPDGPDQLEHGMPVPDPEELYQERLQQRIARLVEAFEASPEWAAAVAEGSSQYLAVFLKMMSDLCCDLTDDAPECSLAWDSVDQLPAWSRTADLEELPRMLAELRSFFAFAARTGAIHDAASWVEQLAGSEVEAMLRHAMRTDPRLKRRARRRSRR